MAGGVSAERQPSLNRNVPRCATSGMPVMSSVTAKWYFYEIALNINYGANREVSALWGFGDVAIMLGYTAVIHFTYLHSGCIYC